VLGFSQSASSEKRSLLLAQCVPFGNVDALMRLGELKFA